MRSLLLAVAVAFLTPSLHPQAGLATHVIGITVTEIPNAPFTARDYGTWTEPLPGGGTVSTRHYTVIARDSNGVVRRETRQRLPADSQADDRLVTFYFLDPTHGTRTNCVVATHLCQITDFPRPILKMAQIPAGRLGKGGFLDRENLGARDFLGLPTTGTRETITTLPDAIGNSGVLIQSSEMWFSADLGMDLYEKRSGPQFGDITLTIGDLVRGEPDPSLLTIPPGYKIVDARASAALH